MSNKKPTQNFHRHQDVNDQGARFRYVFLLILGIILFGLGMFMVSDIHTWPLFRTWLPLVFIFVGIIILGSQRYSLWIALVLFAIGALTWLHEVSTSNAPALTLFIDWSFVVVGTVITAVSLVRLLSK